MAHTPVGPQTTGAVEIFAGVGPGRSHLFLGWGKTSPRFQRRYGYLPFFTDLGGPAIPMDEVFAGQEAYISVDLNFFRADTLGRVESVPNPGGSGALGNVFGDIGTLMVWEGMAYALTLVFPYFFKAAWKAQ